MNNYQPEIKKTLNVRFLTNRLTHIHRTGQMFAAVL